MTRPDETPERLSRDEISWPVHATVSLEPTMTVRLCDANSGRCFALLGLNDVAGFLHTAVLTWDSEHPEDTGPTQDEGERRA